jgi:fibronectin type 3 domain-containing protein
MRSGSRRTEKNRSSLARACEGVVRNPFEILESRVLLTTAPVVIYAFEDPAAGTTVEDTSPENTDNDGILRGDLPGAPNADPTADDPTLFLKFMPATGVDADAPSPAGGQFMRVTGDNAFNGGGGRVQTQDFLGGVDATNDIQGPMDKSSSLSFWIRTTATGTGASWQWPGVTGAEHQGDGNDVFWGIQSTTGQSAVVAGDAAPAFTNNPINDGTWRLITQTRDTTTGQVTTYLNGVVQQQQTNDTAEKGANFRSIGAVANINTLRREDGFAHLNADLDQIQVYDRAIGFLEVAQLFGPPSAAVPSAPAPVNGSSPGPSSNIITWGASAGALGYVIYRSDTAGGTFTQIGLVGDTATSFRDTNTAAGQVHFYQVKAYNSTGLSAASATVPVTTATSGEGVRGSYFNDAFWGGGGRSSTQRGAGGIATFRPGEVPDYSNFVTQVNFDWGTGTPVPGVIRGDFHSTLFTGKITIPADANGDGTPGQAVDVTFVNSSDDDGIIFVNGVEAAQDMGPPGHGQQDRPGSPITLTEGQSYNFSVWQAEQGGGSGVRMKWVNPASGATEVIPASMFTTTMDAPGTPTLSAPVLSNPADADPALARQRMVSFTLTENATNSAAELWFELYRDGVLVTRSPMNATDADSDPANGLQTTITDAQPMAGAHNYQVRAVNYDGASALSANLAVTVPATFNTPANGASAYYFNNGAWNGGELNNPAWGGGQDRRTPGTPDFHEIVATVDIDYGTTANSPALGVIEDDYFSSVHTGEVLIPADFNGNGTPGESIPVQFVGNTDDHGIYYVNGQLAAISYIPRGQGDYTGAGPTTLTEGQRYDFVILQAEQEGGAGVHFKWQNPANANAVEVIPTDNLFPTTGAPAAPTGITGLGLGNVVVLTFNDVATNEVRYDIERGTAAAGPFTKIGSASINATSFADTSVSPGTTYFYRVTAVNYEGQGSTTTAGIPSGTVGAPNAPTITSGVARRNGPRIGFTDNSLNEASFVVQRRLASEPDTAFADVGTVAGTFPGTQGSTLYFQDVTGAVGASYVYRVLARNAGGDGTSANFALINNVAAGTGLHEVAFEDYFNTRQAFIDNIDSGITFVDPAPAAETFGGGPVGPAGLNSGGGGGGPSGVNAADNQPYNVAADTFSVLLTGFFIPDVTGPYTFQSNSDDGVSMEVIDAGPNGTFGDGDDVKLVDFDGSGFLRGMGAGFADTMPTVNLTAGKAYQLRLSMAENGGGAGYRFGYFNPTTGLEALPTELLYPSLPSSSISEVYVRGSTWTPAFKTYMAGQGLGDANLGYRVDNKAATDVAPWINLDEIVLRFSAPPTGGGIPTPGSVVLDGVRSDYTVSTVTALDPQTYVLRLDRTLGNLPTPPGGENGDRVKLTVNGAGPGGAAYVRTINVLQGDVDKNGSVIANDFSDVKKKFFRSTTAPGPAGDTQYTVFHDVDGNGSIIANDFSEVKKRFFDNLPAAPAGASGMAVASITRDLFSRRSILG